MSEPICESACDALNARWTWVAPLEPKYIGRKHADMTPAETLARTFAWRHWLKLEADRLCCREVRS